MNQQETKQQIVNYLSANIDTHLFYKYQELFNKVRQLKRDLYEMEEYPEYAIDIEPKILDAIVVLDRNSDDMQFISQVANNLYEKQSTLEESNKFSEVWFEKIKYKKDCPEQNQQDYSWEDVEFDSMESFVSYGVYDEPDQSGEIWAILGKELSTLDVKETAKYIETQQALVAYQHELDLTINSIANYLTTGKYYEI